VGLSFWYVAIILLVPGRAAACNMCGRQAIYYYMPWLPRVSIVLIAWFILYWTWWAYRQPRHSTRRIAKFIFGNAGALLYLLFVARDAGGVLYFALFYVVTFLRTIYLAICGLLSKSRSEPGGPVQSLSHFRVPLAAGAVCLAVMPILAIPAQMRFNRMDDLERLDEYVQGVGAAIDRALIRRIGNDPHFDVERLRPWLTSADFEQAARAFLILMHRARPDDLLRFRHLILDNTQMPQPFDPNAAFPAPYMLLWFYSLKMPETVTSPDALNAWIDQLAKEKPGEASGDP